MARAVASTRSMPHCSCLCTAQHTPRQAEPAGYGAVSQLPWLHSLEPANTGNDQTTNIDAKEHAKMHSFAMNPSLQILLCCFSPCCFKYAAKQSTGMTPKHFHAIVHTGNFRVHASRIDCTSKQQHHLTTHSLSCSNQQDM